MGTLAWLRSDQEIRLDQFLRAVRGAVAVLFQV